MTERERELEEILHDLVSKLDIVHNAPEYQAVWQISQMHIGPYTGPAYTDELIAAKRILANGELSHEVE